MGQGEPADDEETDGREEPDGDPEGATAEGEIERAVEDVEEAGREPTALTIDERVLYDAVRRAVEDALLGVIGTVLLVGVSLVLVWVGGAMAFSAGAAQPVAAAAGLAIALLGVYLAASALEVIPPLAEWF